MKKFVLAATVTLALMVVGGEASAQLLLDQALTSSIGAGAELGAATRGKTSADDIAQNLNRQGFLNVRPVSETPLTFSATGPGGLPVLLTLEPRTGQIISAVPR